MACFIKYGIQGGHLGPLVPSSEDDFVSAIKVFGRNDVRKPVRFICKDSRTHLLIADDGKMQGDLSQTTSILWGSGDRPANAKAVPS